MWSRFHFVNITAQYGNPCAIEIWALCLSAILKLLLSTGSWLFLTLYTIQSYNIVAQQAFLGQLLNLSESCSWLDCCPSLNPINTTLNSATKHCQLQVQTQNI